MTAGGEEELICDFAETYHVLDWRGLPLHLAAILANGLSENSRSKRKLVGTGIGTETSLLAMILDAVNMLLWRYTERGTEKPQSVYGLLEGKENPAPQRRHRTFRSGADFMREYRRFTEGV